MAEINTNPMKESELNSELKHSIKTMVLITSEIANPSIPSIKLIAFTMIKKTKIVEETK